MTSFCFAGQPGEGGHIGLSIYPSCAEKPGQILTVETCFLKSIIVVITLDGVVSFTYFPLKKKTKQNDKKRLYSPNIFHNMVFKKSGVY